MQEAEIKNVQPPFCKANVSGSFSADTKYRLFLDRMIAEISSLVQEVFEPNGDPEAQWKFFMEQLSHYKREQLLMWLETDDV